MAVEPPSPGGLSGRLAPLRDRLRRRARPRTVFVLSGGGVLGALQVGMLRALLEHRIHPDLVLGCSVGALNGVSIAADPSLTMVGRLQETWLDLEGRDVLPAGLLPTTMQLARKGESVHGSEGLQAVLEEILPVATFEELAVPFQCVATDIAAAREVWFSSGTLVEPILASAALPAMLPPVEIDGVRYIDGAVVNDVPVTRAVDLGATTIYVLHVGGFDRPRPEPKRPFDMALQAYWIARRARFRRGHGRPSVPRGGRAAADRRGRQRPLQRLHPLGHADGQRLPGHRCPAHGPGPGSGRGSGGRAAPGDRRGSGRRRLRHAEWEMSQKTHAGSRGSLRWMECQSGSLPG